MHGLRSFRKSPGLSLAALACIALGIGSAVFLFTLAHGVLAQRLPFPDADRLLRVWKFDRTTLDRMDLSYPDFKDIAARARSFEALEVVARTRLAVVTETETERMRGEAVSSGYFAMIGIQPAHGRLFTKGEYEPGGPRVAVIGHDMWQRKYGGRANIIGTSLRARGFSEGRAHEELRTIVGVMPPGFAGTVDDDVSEFWIPVEHYAPRALLARRATMMSWVMARLRPGVSLSEAQAEIDQIGRGIAAEHPEPYKNRGLRVEPVAERFREKLRTGLMILMAASALLLLIAATNIANLLLARLAQREQELTVRAALGATRARILAQLLGESLLLSAVGGALGIAAAFAGVKAFLAAQVITLPRYVRIEPDLRVVGFALALVIVTGLLFGVVPALFGSRVEVSRHLREAIRGGTQGRRQRLFGETLVALEVAFTVVLLIASALMLRTYQNLVRGDLGFRTGNLLRMAITLDASRYPDAAAQLRFAEEAKVQLDRYPGIEKVTFLGGVLPPWIDNGVGIAVDGRQVEALAEVPLHPVDPDFFGVLDVALLRGRLFGATDGAGSPRVAIVSQQLARAIAGGDGSAAVGRSIQFVTDASAGELSTPREIVGIVEDVRYEGLLSDRVERDLFVPLAQAPDTVLSIGLLTSVDPATLVQPMQRELGRLAPGSPQHWISTMEEELAGQYREARLYAWLSGIFGATALVLAIIGVYGVLANSVSRRFSELGVRIALGAQRRDIVRLVLRQGMTTVVAGLLAGTAMALAATRLLRSLLYGIAPGDPLSFVVVAAAMMICSVVACYVPARRATKVEPVSVLRGQ